MPDFNRRKFLQTSSVLLAASLVTTKFKFKGHTPLLAFSTLGCPDCSFEKITDYAVQYGYKGIELRGIKHELDLTKCNEFSSAKNISATNKLMKDKGLRLVDLGSSATMHFSDAVVRQKN